MHSLIRTIYERADARLLASAISMAEGELISKIIAEREILRTIEVGCANGISSLFICDALAKKSCTVSHTIIDPFQSSHYGRRGVDNLKTAGFNFFNLIEEPSELALPELLRLGSIYDFALIDGSHTFENTLVDFFYLYRLIKVGGVIIMDDVNAEPVKKVVRYICNYPNISIVANVPYGGVRRKLFNNVSRLLGVGLSPITKSLGNVIYNFLADPLIKPERIGSIDSSTMLAFLKIGKDIRPSDWYEPF